MFAHYIRAFCLFISTTVLHNAMRMFGTFFLRHPVYRLPQAEQSKRVCDYVYCDDITSLCYTSNACTRYMRNTT